MANWRRLTGPLDSFIRIPTGRYLTAACAIPRRILPRKRNCSRQPSGSCWPRGFVATTVDEICETAGLTKGSFFHYFASKEDLARVALDRFVQGKAKLFQQGPL
ncbi:TetR/AcrR family transcriptional regulator [Nitrospira sp. Kam-Ns4a]